MECLFFKKLRKEKARDDEYHHLLGSSSVEMKPGEMN